MYNDNAKQFKVLERDYKRWRNQLPRRIAVTGTKFWKRNIQVQGFVDKPFKKWGKSKKKSGQTLVKSGNLRRGIRSLSIRTNRVVWGVDKSIPYAEIHNNGGSYVPTPKQRRYFWAMYMQTNEDQWKGMALAKKIDVEQRQFIGDSKAFPITIDRMIVKDLKHLFR